jgi:hypothetical protein
MSNTKARGKDVRLSNAIENLWVSLAEDAETEVAKARERIKRLKEASRIFRSNAENGVSFPSRQN